MRPSDLIQFNRRQWLKAETLRALLLWPLAAYISFWPLLKVLCSGDSFYAAALKRFYLRQFRLIVGRVRYPPFLGEVNRWAFIYQNFLAISLCYRVLGRRLFVASAILLLVAFYTITQPRGDSMALLIGIFLSSHILLFIVAERGNYQTLGVTTACLALSALQSGDIGGGYLMLAGCTLLLSTSSFLLAGLVGMFVCRDLPIYFVANAGFVVAFLGLNVLFLTSRMDATGSQLAGPRSLLSQLGAGLGAVAVAVGLSRGIAHAAPLPRRKVSMRRGLASALPFVLAALVFRGSASMVCAVGATLIFFNQSKVLRLFDFHLVYFFFFCLLLFSISAASAGLVEYVVFFLVGSNPLILYGLNRANAPAIERASRFIVPPTWTRQQESVAMNGLERILRATPKLVIDDGLRSSETEYNDIFRHNSLLLEFVWDAVPEGVEFFPDWYSLFYTERGVEHYHQLTRGNFSAFSGFVRLWFSQRALVAENSVSVPEIACWNLQEHFGSAICDRYFPKARYLILEVIR